jgi:hypothetical protein
MALVEVQNITELSQYFEVVIYIFDDSLLFECAAQIFYICSRRVFPCHFRLYNVCEDDYGEGHLGELCC